MPLNPPPPLLTGLAAKPRGKVPVEMKKPQAPTGEPLIAPPTGNGKWNSQVLQNAQSNLARPVTPTDLTKSSSNYLDTILTRLKKDQGIEDASLVEKFGAGFEAAKQTNDFFKIGQYLDTRDGAYKPDQNWVDMMKDYDTASHVVLGAGLTENNIVDLSNTVNQDQFLAKVKQIKDNENRQRLVADTLTTSEMVSASLIGGIASPDMIMGITLPYKAIKTTGAVLNAVENTKDAIEVGNAVMKADRIKAVATAAGLGYAAAMPMVRSIVDKDYTATDAAIDFALFSVIDVGMMRHLVGNQKNAFLRSVEDAKRAPLMIEWKPQSGDTRLKMLPNAQSPDKVLITPVEGKVPLIEYRPANTLIENLKKHGAETPDEFNLRTIKTFIGKGGETLTTIAKKIDSATKRLTNPALGKELRAATKSELESLKNDYKAIETGLIGIKNAGNTAKSVTTKLARIEALKTQFPHLVDDLTQAKNIAPHIEEAANSAAEKIGDVKEVLNESAKANGGGKFKLKIGKDGSGSFGLVGKDGKFKPVGNRKIVAAVALAVAAGGVAEASDGSSDSSISLPSAIAGLILLYLAGGTIFSKLKHSDDIKTALQEVISGIKTAITSTPSNPDNKLGMGKVLDLINISREKIGSTYASAIKSMHTESVDLAKGLFHDPTNAYTDVVEVMKFTNHHANMQSFYKVYNSAFALFKKDNPLPMKSKLDSFFNHNKQRSDFNKLVSDYVENPNLNVHPSVKKVADEWKRAHTDIFNRGFESGVFKTKEMYRQNYIPQLVDYKTLYRAIVRTAGQFTSDSPVYKQIYDNFAMMYAKAHPSATIDDINTYMERVMDSVRNGNSFALYNESRDVLGDITNRAKFRIELDKTHWKPIEMTIDGKTEYLGLDDVFERDIEDIMAHYSNSMEGHIAIGKKFDGKSYTDLLAIADRESDSTIQRALVNAIHTIIGRPVFDTGTQTAQIANAMRNYSAPIYLSMSAIMQISEGLKVMIPMAKNWGEFKIAINEYVNVLKHQGSDNAIINELMGMTGLGASVMTDRMSLRGFDDLTNMSGRDIHDSRFIQSSYKIRDAAMYAYQVAPTTDVIQRISLLQNIERLVRTSKGIESMSKTELEMFGLTEKDMERINKIFDLNEMGRLKKFDSKSFSKTDYDLIQRVMFNMNQHKAQVTTLGGTADWMRNSPIGQALGTLMSFPMQAFNNHAVTDTMMMARGEPQGYYLTAMWFASMYAAGVLKAEIKGKDYKEEDMIMYALSNMPQAMPVTMMQMISQPIATTVPQKFEEGLMWHVRNLGGILNE